MAQICAGSIGKRVANRQALQLSRGGRKWNLYFWRVLKVEIKSGQMIEVLFRAEFSLRRMFPVNHRGLGGVAPFAHDGARRGGAT